MNIKEIVAETFSGDNTKIDYTHVWSSLIVSIIMAMWVWKSWDLVSALCDFPPGVQLVLFAAIGAAPISAGVNVFNKLRGQPSAMIKTRTVTATNSVTAVTEDDGDPKP